MEKRLASQGAELEAMRCQRDDWRQLQQQQHQQLSAVKVESARAVQEEQASNAEAHRLQENLAMAQQESELLLLLLSGKVKRCVDSLAAAFAEEGSWVEAQTVGRDLTTLQRLVEKGVEALSL